jgi:hypothetical protein
MAISRMQQPRQMYQRGGIMEVAPRQGAIFGGLKKAVSSALGSAKKLLKSDLGKAALLAGGAYFAPTLFGKSAGFGNFGNLLKGGIGNLSSTLGLGVKEGANPTFGQMAKVFGIGSLGGAALQALEAAGLDTDNPNTMPRDVESLKAYLRQGYKQLNQEASPEQVEAFVTANTTEYKADGGRIGYADGMNDPSDLPRGLQIDTTTRNPIPENALQEEIETVVRIMMGPGSAGIGELEDGTMKGYQFFRKQYLPKKITELSENYGYSEDEIYKMLNLKVREFQESPELLQKPKMAMGGRIGYAFGNDPEQNAVEASGIMNLPLNQNPAGTTELDLRETGGFIPPVGVKEKEDDIPAMLSNNEFVFTADAVRGMGDGDVNKGAQRMYDMMKKLEGGGRV